METFPAISVSVNTSYSKRGIVAFYRLSRVLGGLVRTWWLPKAKPRRPYPFFSNVTGYPPPWYLMALNIKMLWRNLGIIYVTPAVTIINFSLTLPRVTLLKWTFVSWSVDHLVKWSRINPQRNSGNKSMIQVPGNDPRVSSGIASWSSYELIHTSAHECSFQQR